MVPIPSAAEMPCSSMYFDALSGWTIGKKITQGSFSNLMERLLNVWAHPDRYTFGCGRFAFFPGASTAGFCCTREVLALDFPPELTVGAASVVTAGAARGGESDFNVVFCVNPGKGAVCASAGNRLMVDKPNRLAARIGFIGVISLVLFRLNHKSNSPDCLSLF